MGCCGFYSRIKLQCYIYIFFASDFFVFVDLVTWWWQGVFGVNDDDLAISKQHGSRELKPLGLGASICAPTKVVASSIERGLKVFVSKGNFRVMSLCVWALNLV